MPLETSTYRPTVVAAARQVYGDGRDVSEFDVSIVVPMVLVPLRRDVLRDDLVQAQREELPERWDGLS